MPGPDLRLEGDRIGIGDKLWISFQRTLRVPDDGNIYPLPPGLGRFPVHRTKDFADRVPATWMSDSFFMPMYQREALWLGFDAPAWHPSAVHVGVGGIDAVSGATWEADLRGDPQNYIVCPPQLWLDGINAGAGYVRQFSAMPLGLGLTVEAQLTGLEDVGGLQLAVYPPWPGLFSDEAPPDLGSAGRPHAAPAAMGFGAGGRMEQRIYPDPHGLATWDVDQRTEMMVYLLNSEQYEAVTGLPPPSTPVDTNAYTQAGLPWFTLYDEDLGDVAPAEPFVDLKSVTELERSELPETPASPSEEQIRLLPRSRPPSKGSRNLDTGENHDCPNHS